MDLYPVNALTAPQEAHTATAGGTLPVRATLSVSGLAAGERTSAVFTVKRRGALVAKQAVEFIGIDPAQPVERAVTLDVPVTAGDQLFFDLSSRDSAFAARLTTFAVTTGTDPNLQTLPATVHTRAAEGLFPQPYRGWAVAGYNGNSPRDSQPIDQNLLVLSGTYDPNNARVYPFAPNPAAAAWGGPDEAAWVKAGEASASRLGLDDIRMPRSEQFAGAGAVPRISRSINIAVSAGFGASTGDSRSTLEFQDLNGDRYPDVISDGGVQFSRGRRSRGRAARHERGTGAQEQQ